MPAEVAPSHVFVARLAEVGGRVRLDEEESHYVLRVCRARAGGRLTATDGLGLVAHARLTDVSRSAEIEIEGLEHVEPARRAELVCGAPEGQRADWLVEKLAEFGVSALQPLDCARAAWESFDRRVERWRRLARAALRQSRGAWLMEVRPPIRLDELAGAPLAGESRWLADAAGARVAGSPAGAGVSLGLIGPAEGLDADERAWALGAEFVPMRLASNRLRCETAALAWAAWWANGAGGAASERPGP